MLITCQSCWGFDLSIFGCCNEIRTRATLGRIAKNLATDNYGVKMRRTYIMNDRSSNDDTKTATEAY